MVDPSAVPVVLVHGFAGSTRHTWEEVGWLDLLRDMGRSPIGIDLLGHGSAPKPHDPAAYEHLADHLESELPPSQVDGIGFSLGARLLLEVACRQPHRFRRLVLAGIGANVLTDESSTLLASSIRQGAGEHPLLRYFHSQAHRDGNDPAALQACLSRPGVRPLTAAELEMVRVPVLLVIGERDFTGPADPLRDLLPDAQLLVLPSIDHFATPKQFAFIDAALEFLA